MLRLLNFRCSFCSNPLDETQCGLYREGGPEALEPGRRGRPEGPGGRTRERELEERVRKLEAQVAYLKKSIALKAEKSSRTGRRPRS